MTMKIYLPVACLLLLFSSCIKTEYYPLCNDAPAAPSLSATTISVGYGDSFTVPVVSPLSGITYTWIGPAGYAYNGSILNYSGYYNGSPYGRWGVVGKKGSALCVSDTTYFNVNLGISSCVGNDTFKISGTGVYALHYAGINTSNGNYEARFIDNAGNELDIYLLNQPSSSGVYNNPVSDPFSVSYPTDFYVEFTSPSLGNYVSQSGTVFASVNGSVLTIGFCNMIFYSYYNQSTYGGSAVLKTN
jgi:hypothetical protein